MITALQTPAAGTLLLDANNTIIRVQSTNGAGHYFRAKIYIGGELFDQQGWSRVDEYTAAKDLKKLFSAYFETLFPETFTNLLEVQGHLRKSVSINVEEYSLETGELTGLLNLPTFEVLYSVKPEAFSDTARIAFLGVNAQRMVVPKNGKIAFPFYVSAASAGETVAVTLANNFGFQINAQSVASVKGKQVLLYQFDLSGVSFALSTLYLTATASVGEDSISKVYRINRLPDNPVKEIAFANNFGFYLFAYPDGVMETEDNFTPETYERADGSMEVFEVSEETKYTINSGSFVDSERAVLNMVANSLDSRLRVAGQWVKMVSATKKIDAFADRQHLYEAALQFTVKKGTDVANTGLVEVTPEFPDIYITGYEVSGTTVTLSFTTNNGYSPTALTLQVRTNPALAWNNAGGGSPVSPRTLILPAGVYYVRIVDTPLFPSHVSNTITVTV